MRHVVTLRKINYPKQVKVNTILGSVTGNDPLQAYLFYNRIRIFWVSYKALQHLFLVLAPIVLTTISSYFRENIFSGFWTQLKDSMKVGFFYVIMSYILTFFHHHSAMANQITKKINSFECLRYRKRRYCAARFG
jgi:hypothetical protein